MKFLVFLLVGVLYANAEVARFDGHRVYRVFPVTQKQLDVIETLERTSIYDFWSEPNNKGMPVDIMVAPHQQGSFEEIINENGMGAEIYIQNVQELIDQEVMAKGADAAKAVRAEMLWTQYYDGPAINAWLAELAANYSTVEVFTAGNSYENRPIQGVKISFGPGRRVVMIEAGIHAREWIAPATANYVIHQILTSTDPRWRRIAESFDWYIIPSSNPDGYQHSISNYRLWRKTRTPYAGGCYGADPNRNFNFTWGEHGSSTSACSDTYRGPEPFSEKEVQAIKSVIDSVASEMDVYLAMHSYGQYLLIPYGNTTAHLGNYDDLATIGRAAALTLQSKYGTRYTVGNTAEVLYRASGTSADWAKYTYGTGITYTYEFRDTGSYGFVLPPSQIFPNCDEVLASLVTMFEEAARLGYVNLGSAYGEPVYV